MSPNEPGVCCDRWPHSAPLSFTRRFLDNIEPTERVYHVGDVGPALELAAALVEAEKS